MSFYGTHIKKNISKQRGIVTVLITRKVLIYMYVCVCVCVCVCVYGQSLSSVSL